MLKDQWAVIVTGTTCALALSFLAALVCEATLSRWTHRVRQKKAIDDWSASEPEIK